MKGTLIEKNLKAVLDSIQQIKNKFGIKENIKLIAVSKYTTQEEIQLAYNAGQVAFAENKIQDFNRKKIALKDLDIEWHFIGHLQENKINALLRLKPVMLHSLDSYKLAIALQKRLERDKINIKALMQVNSTHEESKHGFHPDIAKESFLKIQQTCPNIKLKGLMCIGANSNNIDCVKKSFYITKKIFDTLGSEAKILSMGMSNDYKLALEMGSNCIRIGSNIFNNSH